MPPMPATALTSPSSAPATASHVRVHGSVLAAAEKRLLVWLAERLPLIINSDHLTSLGAVAMVGAGAAFWAASWDRRALWLVPAMLFVNWFGDSLDGTVARVRGHQRPRYGYYLDHVIDIANTAALFVGMAASGLMHPVIGMGVLLGYVMLCAESFLATHALGVFRISFSGVGPTELRILLSIGAIAAIGRPVITPFGWTAMPLFDVGAGNVGVTGTLVAATGWPLIPANAVAVLVLSLVNYLCLDRWVFSQRRTRAFTGMSRTASALVVCAAVVWATHATPAEAAPPSEATAGAWSRRVAATESRLDEALSSSGRFLALDALPAAERRALRTAILRGEVPVVNVASEQGEGDGVAVPDGMIHHWRGWLFIPGATVHEVVRGIVEPAGARAHRQEDVLEVKVLERRADGLRLFLKLQRRKIVTVTYNTEHAVRYRMHAGDRASSRSIATRIRELADAGTPDERERRPDEDRGFLWGMNSYWRYQAVSGGVIVEMESLTLSRDVPWGVGTVVRPLIDRVARESVVRTMTAMRTRFEPQTLATR